MALVLLDRAKETTIVLGTTASAILLGASSGYQSFAGVGNANATYYCIAEQAGPNWEVGLGTYTLVGTILTRAATPLSSSNAGASVSFPAGTKDIFIVYPSAKGVWLDASGNAIGLGTPAAFVGTNITGTATAFTASNVTTNANLTGAVTSVGNASSLGSFTSLQLATALTDETGTGANVFATSPTLVTPVLGTPTSGTLTSCTGLPLTTGVTGTLGVANGGTGGVVGGVEPIQPVTASVGSSALTVTLNPTILNFRNTPLTSGTINTRTVASAISVVVPSTATLGTVSAQQSRIVVIALDNAGTVELAVVNIAGGTNLDETTLISTTAISAGATSASVVYSTTARTSLPFRVVGYIESTQATAGTWATAPSIIQGCGGQAMAAMSSVGCGQTWQAVTRVSGTTYYNTTGKPIVVLATVYILNTGNCTLTVNGVLVQSVNISIGGAPNANLSAPLTAIIPAWASYVISSASITCVELR